MPTCGNYFPFHSCEDDADYQSIKEDQVTEVQNKLKKLCGTSNLDAAFTMSLNMYPINSLLSRGCHWLPNLRSLSLTNSSISSLRCLGTFYPNVTELAVINCQLNSLDGTSSFPKLQMLNAADNNITDLDPCIYLQELCHINLERNQIQDVKAVDSLSFCSNLTSVSLLGNPFCFKDEYEETKVTSYEGYVKRSIPNLRYFNGCDLLLQSRPSTPKKDILFEHKTKSSGNNSSLFSDVNLSQSGQTFCGNPGRAFRALSTIGVSETFDDDVIVKEN